MGSNPVISTKKMKFSDEKSDEKKYSYREVISYAKNLIIFNKLNKDISNKLLLNDLISLITDFKFNNSSKYFWKSIDNKKINSRKYKILITKVKKYLVKDFPIAYLTKRCYFYGLELYVKKGVFIPQPCTEIIVDWILNNCDFNLNKNLKILEIGSGCGNISIAIGINKRNWKIFSLDNSDESINVSRININRYCLDNIKLLKSDVFSNLKEKNFDVLISNPPYISLDEEISLSATYQPFMSLFSDRNGLDFYYKILSGASCFLSKNFLIIFEIGYQQKNDVIKIVLEKFSNPKIEVIEDFEGFERFVVIQP